MPQQSHRHSGIVRRSALSAGRLRTALAIGASAGAIALLGALPAAPANATPAAAGATSLTPASLTLPRGDLEPILSGLPVNLLAELSSKLNPLLGGLSGEVTTLVGKLLEGNPQASVGEVLGSVDGLLSGLLGNQVALGQVLEGLNPEQLSTVLGGLLSREGVQSLVDQLAGRLGSLGSEGQQTLRSILTALLGSLPEGPRTVATQIQQTLEEAGDGALQAILEGLREPGALSSAALERVESLLGELSTLSPAELQQQLGQLLGMLNPEEASALLSSMLGTLSPTQLRSVIEGLLGGLGSLTSTGTPEELVQATGGSLSGLAAELGTSVEGLPASLPAVTSTLGSEGPALSVLDGLGHLVLSLAGEPTATGEGASGGSGGAGGASGSGGSGGSGGAGSTGSPAGGSGSQLSVVLNAASASPSGSASAKGKQGGQRSGRLRILNHWVRGDTATVALHVPAAGRLVVTGKGLHREARRVGHARRMVMRVKLTSAVLTSLHHHRRTRIRMKAIFRARHGAGSMARATLTFHRHPHHRRRPRRG